jgi:hypothetical protein
MCLAWNIARLMRAKKLPSLNKLLIRKHEGTRRRKTWQQQFALVRAWHERTKKAAANARDRP